MLVFIQLILCYQIDIHTMHDLPIATPAIARLSSSNWWFAFRVLAAIKSVKKALIVDWMLSIESTLPSLAQNAAHNSSPNAFAELEFFWISKLLNWNGSTFDFDTWKFIWFRLLQERSFYLFYRLQAILLIVNSKTIRRISKHSPKFLKHWDTPM